MHGTTPIILGESDFNTLKHYMAHRPAYVSPASLPWMSELKFAIVVEDDILPKNCVRLNSTIQIRKYPGNQVLEFSIVFPEIADIRKKRISFLDPWGAAFLGLSKTEKVEREINGNQNCFEILDVKPFKPD
jgi:transcription elongation GreA/GreB family factor